MTRVSKSSGVDTPYNSTFNFSDVFPLKGRIFEGYEFPVPNNAEAVLATRYGKNYNNLPDSFGYSHHLQTFGF